MEIAGNELAGQIDRDMPCISCHYSLRSLHRDGRCPECGAFVWDSFLQHRLKLARGLGSLETADRRWLVRISEGAAWNVLGFILFSIQACTLNTFHGSQKALAVAWTCGIWTICWYGGWKLSSPEPGYDQGFAHRIYRHCITVYSALPVLLAFSDFVGDLITVLTCVVLLAGLIATVMHYLLIAHYGQRLQSLWIQVPSLLLVCVSAFTFFLATGLVFFDQLDPVRVLPDTPVFSLNSPTIAGELIKELIYTQSAIPVILLGYFLLIGCVHVGLWRKLRNVAAQLQSSEMPAKQCGPVP